MAYRPAPKKKLKASPAVLKYRRAIKEKLASTQLDLKSLAKNTAKAKSTDARKRRKQGLVGGKFKGSFLNKLDK